MISARSTFNHIISFLIVVSFCLSCNSSSENSSKTETESVTPDFQISLAQWSLHRKYFGNIEERGGFEWFMNTLMTSPDDAIVAGQDPMNFPEEAAKYGVNSIELVNTFYFGKADDMAYWTAFKEKCEKTGVQVGLIMCDVLGDLGDADAAARTIAIEKHYKWVDIAKFLGAHTIRVNAAGQGTAEEVAANAANGLKRLGEYGASKGINVVVENHGGFSSNGTWLAGVMEAVGMDNVGTLPDFGNFCIQNGPDGCINEYDRYKGIEELMPYAKAVSAKAHVFDENGNEVKSDFLRIMKIVKAAGFKGHIGIEYEGSDLSEDEGIKKTKALLEKVFKAIE